MNEYSVDWPLWDEDGLCPEGRPALSETVRDEVLRWAAVFNEDYSVEAGWPTEAAARSSERQARRLFLLVERELPPGDELVLGYWETNRRTGL